MNGKPRKLAIDATRLAIAHPLVAGAIGPGYAP
jgi:hypothetical protein